MFKIAIIVSQNSKFCSQMPFPTGKCYEGESLYCSSIVYLFIYGHGYVSFSFLCIYNLIFFMFIRFSAILLVKTTDSYLHELCTAYFT